MSEKEAKSNDKGVVGVTLGIISLIFMGYLGIITAIIGLVFSLKQKKTHPNKWSKAGVILNVLGIILGVLAVFVITTYGSSYLQQINQIANIQ